MNRDFEYKGLDFHLNDNYPSEFEGKYVLLWWNDLRCQWQRQITCDTKKEALQWVKNNIDRWR